MDINKCYKKNFKKGYKQVPLIMKLLLKVNMESFSISLLYTKSTAFKKDLISLK